MVKSNSTMKNKLYKGAGLLFGLSALAMSYGCGAKPDGLLTSSRTSMKTDRPCVVYGSEIQCDDRIPGANSYRQNIDRSVNEFGSPNEAIQNYLVSHKQTPQQNTTLDNLVAAPSHEINIIYDDRVAKNKSDKVKALEGMSFNNGTTYEINGKQYSITPWNMGGNQIDDQYTVLSAMEPSDTSTLINLPFLGITALDPVQENEKQIFYDISMTIDVSTLKDITTTTKLSPAKDPNDPRLKLFYDSNNRIAEDGTRKTGYTAGTMIFNFPVGLGVGAFHVGDMAGNTFWGSNIDAANASQGINESIVKQRALGSTTEKQNFTDLVDRVVVGAGSNKVVYVLDDMIVASKKDYNLNSIQKNGDLLTIVNEIINPDKVKEAIRLAGNVAKPVVLGGVAKYIHEQDPEIQKEYFYEVIEIIVPCENCPTDGDNGDSGNPMPEF